MTVVLLVAAAVNAVVAVVNAVVALANRRNARDHAELRRLYGGRE